jgi:hypothetical protein
VAFLLVSKCHYDQLPRLPLLPLLLDHLSSLGPWKRPPGVQGILDRHRYVSSSADSELAVKVS